MKDLFDPEMIAKIRKEYPNKIAEDLCSIQPMDHIKIEDLRAAFEWLQQSRIARGVHPITEQPLDPE